MNNLQTASALSVRTVDTVIFLQRIHGIHFILVGSRIIYACEKINNAFIKAESNPRKFKLLKLMLTLEVFGEND